MSDREDGTKRRFRTQSLFKHLTKEQVEKLGLGENDIFVCLDSALDDTTKVNIGRNLIVKVI